MHREKCRYAYSLVWIYIEKMLERGMRKTSFAIRSRPRSSPSCGRKGRMSCMHREKCRYAYSLIWIYIEKMLERGIRKAAKTSFAIGFRPSSSLAFTRYCHHQYCMVHGIQKGGRQEGVYFPMVVQ